MSPQVSVGMIIRYTSNNFRFIILDPTQRTSKSAPRFLPEKQGRKHASTPMHRLPQYHRGNPRVECQDTYQVNQYDTPIVTSSIHIASHISCVLISEYSIRQDKTLKGKDLIHHNKSIEGRNIIWFDYINKAHDIDHEREIKHITTGTNPQPRGWTTPSLSWRAPGGWRGPPGMDPPLR